MTVRLAPAALAALTGAAALAGCTQTPPPAAAPVYYPISPPSLPFSEAVRDGSLLFVSGQIGVAPGTLNLVPGGLKPEAAQALANVRAAVEAHGSSMDEVVKCTVFLADMREWGDFNEVYRRAFTGKLPARSALGASGLALGARVEVECIAHVSGDGKK